jgi:hypothetical protein
MPDYFLGIILIRQKCDIFWFYVKHSNHCILKNLTVTCSRWKSLKLLQITFPFPNLTFEFLAPLQNDRISLVRPLLLIRL